MLHWGLPSLVDWWGFSSYSGFIKLSRLVALAHGLEALALGFWPLWCFFPGAMAPLEMIPIFLGGWRFLTLMAGLSRDSGSGGIFRRGTGLWLMAVSLDLFLRDGVFSLKGMCSRGGHWLLASGPTFSRTVKKCGC